MNNNKKVCVIMHLFYYELFGELSTYIDNITHEYDLYVTLTKSDGSDIQMRDVILEKYPHAKVYILENKGMDIYPFLFVMNEISKADNKYRYLIKLHGKKSLNNNIWHGERWRKMLCDAILGSKEVFEHNVLLMEAYKKIKLISSSEWLKKQKVSDFEHKFFKEPIADGTEYTFSAGTIFMADFILYMDWFNQNEIYNRFHDQFPSGYVADNSLAHEIERVLGCLVSKNYYLTFGR